MPESVQRIRKSVLSYSFILFIYFFIFGWAGSSLAVASRGDSLVAVYSFLIAVASLVEKLLEHGPSGARASAAVAPGLESTGSVVVVCGPSCSLARGILPDQGLNLCLLCCKQILYS